MASQGREQVTAPLVASAENAPANDDVTNDGVPSEVDSLSLTSEPRMKSWCGSENLRALWGLFALNTVFALAQFVAALAANSVSMLSDTGSMGVDSLAYFANILLERRKHLLGAKKTRFWEAFVSFMSASLLVLVTMYAIIDAAQRLKNHNDSDGDDESVDGRYVFAFALANFILDIIMCTNYFYQIRSRRLQISIQEQIIHEAHDQLNMVSAFIHLFADTLRSVTSLIAGALESKYPDDGVAIDSIATFAVCGTILLAACFVLYEAFYQYLDYKAHPEDDDVVSVESSYTPLV